MPKKPRKNSYRTADTIIAFILGGVLGFVISLMTGELRNPIVFHGDLIAAFAVFGASIGFLGGKQSTHLLEDVIDYLRELWYWRNNP